LYITPEYLEIAGSTSDISTCVFNSIPSRYLASLHFKSFAVAFFAISRGFLKSKLRLSQVFSPHGFFPSLGGSRYIIFIAYSFYSF